MGGELLQDTEPKARLVVVEERGTQQLVGPAALRQQLADAEVAQGLAALRLAARYGGGRLCELRPILLGIEFS